MIDHKITYLIVEDIESHALVLQKMLADYAQFEFLGIADHKEDAIAKIMYFKPDIVFMDIQLEKENGMDILNECKSHLNFVVFTTAYSQYAIQSFDFNTINYLLKPYKKEHVAKTVEKAIQLIQNYNPVAINKTELTTTTLQQNTFKKNILFIPDKNKLIPIQCADIMYMQAKGSYAIIYVNDKTYSLTKTLKNLLETINLPDTFIRVHKSYAVNINFITEIKRGLDSKLVLNNEIELPISIQEKDTVFTMLGIKN